MARVYFHIDLNAFFANAEILLDPSLKGKPVAVSGQTRRSVVSTASYEARSFGVHSAMPITEARKLCRELIVVEPHFHWYRELSDDFIRIIRKYTNLVEQASIDECYADMTDTILTYSRPLDLAWKIQKEILNDLHLPCSIGVGPNMFLAKMASDMKKPMGITVLRIREVSQKLWPLPIGEMRGIGSKTVPEMEEIGIHTIGDLANWKDKAALRYIFGKNTDAMILRANGYDDRQLVTEYDAKSMGVSETLLEDITDYDEIKGLLRTLSRKLSKRLHEASKAGSSLSIRIKYYDFQNNDRSHKLEEPIWKADDIYVQAVSLFNDNWDGDPVRLLGISVSDFASDTYLAKQIDLFNLEEAEKQETASLLRELNQELGGIRLMRASEVKKNEN